MTLRMYADRKGWPVKGILTEVRHCKIHAQDHEDGDGRKKLDHFERSVRLEGQLSDEQRQRLLDIADRCPVHRTLASQVSITTQLAG